MKLITQLKKYFEFYPEERKRLSPFVEQIESTSEASVDFFDRKRLPGHITASAILIENQKILLLFHPFLKKWLQPGGHVDEGETPLQAATRELLEETGFTAIAHPWHEEHPFPFEIDIHSIPANPKRGEEAHLHYDFRYLMVLDENIPRKNSEDHAASWIELEKVEEPNLISLIEKISQQEGCKK